MKHILNNISENEKNEILGHYTGQLKIDNSKFNKLVENKLGDVKPLLLEQETPKQSDLLLKAGYKKVDKIELPNGEYVGNPDGYSKKSESEGLNSVKDYHLYDRNNQFTGYVLQVTDPSRSGYSNIQHILSDDNKTVSDEFFFNEIWFKPVNYKPIKQENPQTPKQGENVKIVTNKIATEGIKNVSSEMISAKPFEGFWQTNKFGGVFNGVNYEWDLSGVDGFTGGPRSDAPGLILAGSHSDLQGFADKRGIDVSDASPKGTVIIGFHRKGSSYGFMIYLSKTGPKYFSFK